MFLQPLQEFTMLISPLSNYEVALVLCDDLPLLNLRGAVEPLGNRYSAQLKSDLGLKIVFIASISSAQP